MTGENFLKNNKQANDNEKVVDRYYLQYMREIKEGNFKTYLTLARIYEDENRAEKNIKKALIAYEKFYEEYRRLVPAKFNVIEYLVNLGNRYKSIGENFKAAEWYLKASLHIIEEHKGEKMQQKIFKKYKLEKLLKETGYHQIV